LTGEKARQVQSDLSIGLHVTGLLSPPQKANTGVVPDGVRSRSRFSGPSPNSLEARPPKLGIDPRIRSLRFVRFLVLL